MNKVKYYIILFYLALLLFNCSQPNELDVPVDNNKPKYSIPDSIIYKSNSIIISKVGQEFFNSYIKLDSINSKFTVKDSFCIQNPSACEDYRLKPYYYMKYKFQMGCFEDAGSFIDFVLDTTGLLISSRAIYGIPKCTNNCCWNNFPIVSKNRAVEIAKEKGLEPGIKEWKIRLIFHVKYADYYWSITNTIEENNSPSTGYYSRGRGILINANDEKLIELFGWGIIS